MRGYTTLRKDGQYWVLVQILIVEIAGRWESGHSLRRPEPRPRLPALPAMSSLSDFELSFLDLFRQFDAADRDSRRIESLFIVELYGVHPLLASTAQEARASLCAIHHDWLGGRLHILLPSGADTRRFPPAWKGNTQWRHRPVRESKPESYS